MKLIIGLGNPGKEYQKTRHNIGFMAVEQFLKAYEPEKETVWTDSKKFKSDIADIEWDDDHGHVEKVILVKPKTFMNNSGMAVALLAKFYKVKSEDIWIVHDEVDFPAGTMRIRLGGASAGHRGVMSIIEALGTDVFWRFRLGIGRPGEEREKGRGVSEYVLEGFDHGDKRRIREMLKHTVKALEMGLQEDLQRAMNMYNTK